MSLFREMKLPDTFGEYKVNNVEERIINSLSQVNIFIGSNNSGKSRFLRKLISEENLLLKLNINYESINREIQKLKLELQQIKDSFNLQSFGKIFEIIKDVREFSFISKTENWFNIEVSNLSLLKQIDNSVSWTYNSTGVQPRVIKEALTERIRSFASTTLSNIIQLVPDELKGFKTFKVYIPSLRGLRTLGDTNSNPYLERTEKDYLKKKNNAVEIFTGLEMYEHCKKLLLGNLEDREKITLFQEFLSEAFFNKNEVAIIPRHDSDVLSIKIGDEHEQPIHNLGDGIQSLIIFTFPLFLYSDRKLLMFIEEPELYLHPGLQRKLIEIFLRKKFENVQFFFATHSNHLLDLTLDYSGISVYSFSKQLPETAEKEKLPTFTITNISNPNSNLLAAIGVKNSSVFLSNCSIWVEGITDRLYLRKYLKLFLEKKNEQNEIKEDIHFSFIEYSGNNITHWSFLDKEEDPINYSRITNKIFLIADKDNGKEERHEKLKEKLEDKFYLLPVREVENLLSEDVLKKIIADYEKIDINDLQLKKTFSFNNYRNKKLGDFIEDNLQNKKRKGSYSDSGTVSDKINFCKKALNYIDTYDSLTDAAKELTEKIYNFIKESNK